MIPWELLDSANVPNSCDKMLLYKRGDEFSIRVSGNELMNSRAHGSEEALAKLTCKRIDKYSTPKILVGGLGMGFTLRAALDNLPSGATIIVAELVEAVIKWNQTHLKDLAGCPLKDHRVSVVTDNVARILQNSCSKFDAVLLDVDNGPEGLTRKDNDRLYSVSGLKTAYQAIRPKGVLAVWSAGPCQAFGKRLQKSPFTVKECQVRARKQGGSKHTIWLAIKD